MSDKQPPDMYNPRADKWERIACIVGGIVALLVGLYAAWRG